MDDIRIVKLVNSEQILAKVSRTESGDYILHKPVVAFGTPEGIAIRPWLFGEDDDVEINRIHVITTVEAPEDLARPYYQNVHGGIVLPTAQETNLFKAGAIVDKEINRR